MINMIRFAWGLIIISIVAIFVIAAYFLFNGFAINLTMMVLSALAFIVGILLLVTDFGAQMGIVDEIENIEQHIGDDIQSFRDGYFNYVHFKIAALMIAIPIEIYLIFRYQKWTAQWGSIPVIIIAVIVIAAVLYGGVTMNWFQTRLERTKWWVFALFLIGWVLSAAVGTYYGEPIELIETPRIENTDSSPNNTITSSSYSYNWSYTRASRFSYFSDMSGVNFDVGDCDGDACGYVMLFIIIVALVIICVMASAMIPHFWVLATSLLLAAMLIVTLLEVLVVPTVMYKDSEGKRWDTP